MRACVVKPTVGEMLVAVGSCFHVLACAQGSVSDVRELARVLVDDDKWWVKLERDIAEVRELELRDQIEAAGAPSSTRPAVPALTVVR